MISHRRELVKEVIQWNVTRCADQPADVGIYDHEEDEIILETTRNGVEVYAEMMGLEE